MKFPEFKYHRDPLATGSIEPRVTQCVCCRETRSYAYTGPVYSGYDLQDALCPWCIASGLAHMTYAAHFSDDRAFTDPFFGPAVPASVVSEVVERTPGFSGW